MESGFLIGTSQIYGANQEIAGFVVKFERVLLFMASVL